MIPGVMSGRKTVAILGISDLVEQYIQTSRSG